MTCKKCTKKGSDEDIFCYSRRATFIKLNKLPTHPKYPRDGTDLLPFLF